MSRTLPVTPDPLPSAVLARWLPISGPPLEQGCCAVFWNKASPRGWGVGRSTTLVSTGLKPREPSPGGRANPGGISSSSHSYLDGIAQVPLDGPHRPKPAGSSTRVRAFPGPLAHTCYLLESSTRKSPPPRTVKDPASGSTRPVSDQKQCWGTGRYAGCDGCSGETAEGFAGGKRGCMTSTFRWPMVLSFSSLHTHLHTCMSMHMLPLDICTHACLCTYYHRNTKHLLQALAKRSWLPAHGLLDFEGSDLINGLIIP